MDSFIEFRVQGSGSRLSAEFGVRGSYLYSAFRTPRSALHEPLLRSHAGSRHALALANAAAGPHDQTDKQRQNRREHRRLNLVIVLDLLQVLVAESLDLCHFLIALAAQSLLCHFGRS